MKFERMLAIVMLLLQRKKITGKELAEMFEVSIRTIYRDIEAINAAGIPIVTTSGIGGGISIIEQYKIEKGIFTADDISTILMGLGIVHSALSQKDIVNVQAKLRSFISEELEDDIAVKKDQFMFDLSSWIKGKDSNQMIDTVKSAMEKKHTLTFSYLGHKGKEKLYGIEPHRLVFKDSQWYLQSYSTKKHTPSGMPLSNQQLPILPGRLQPSTFGVYELNYCVRDGNRWILIAIATESVRVCTLKTT